MSVPDLEHPWVAIQVKVAVGHVVLEKGMLSHVRGDKSSTVEHLDAQLLLCLKLLIPHLPRSTEHHLWRPRHPALYPTDNHGLPRPPSLKKDLEVLRKVLVLIVKA